MSRGPGRWQRAILEALEANPTSGVVVTDGSASEQAARRSAANRLERRGLVVVASVKVDGRPRLVAYLPGRAPAFRHVVGLDGRTYRLPIN